MAEGMPLLAPFAGGVREPGRRARDRDRTEVRHDEQEPEPGAHRAAVRARALEGGETHVALPDSVAVEPSSRARRFVQPEPGDTLASIAQRELPELSASEALRALQSWNLHIVVRPGLAGALIGADIVYLEPPLPR